MKISGWFSKLFLFIMVLGVVAGCASTPTREGTGEYLDDSVITAKVKAALLAESSLKSMEINVETFKGEVQLSGFVSYPVNIKTAVEVARHVDGVKAVTQAMKLKGT